VGCVTNDNKISFWSISGNHKLIMQAAVKDTQTHIWYFEESGIWATANLDSVVTFWEMPMSMKLDRSDMMLRFMFKVTTHEEQITGLLEVATGSPGLDFGGRGEQQHGRHD